MSQTPTPALQQDPRSIDWTRVSARYLKLRLIQHGIWCVLCVGIFSIPLVGIYLWDWGFPLWLAVALVAGMVLWQLVGFFLIPRQVKSWGYAEFEHHLVLVRGVLSRRVTSVPYGRMQTVEVSSGPIESMFKLASVELQTASAGTSATIHGLEQSEAERLRDVLTDRGETQLVKM